MAYRGRHQLWLAPGTEAREGDVEATLEDDVLRWRWTLGDDTHEGELHLDGTRWRDTFHQAEARSLDPERTFGARFAGSYAYGPDEDPWGWRIVVAERPSGELIVQMFNLTPWGGGARAVQWVLAAE